MSRLSQAKRIATLLNAGFKPREAIADVGIDPDDVFSENTSVFDLDDPDNDMIDLGLVNDTAVLVKRTSSRSPWEVHTIKREVS